MVNRSERIILAAIISLICFLFSLYWYRNGRTSTITTQASVPIAVLESSSSDVQRKPARRVIWQRISIGDLLYAKEAIRTPSDTSAEITFIESKTKIELEPDSVIVLEETSGDVALNFLKGNVFVAGGGDGGLKIKSGDSVVEAGSGEVNLSKQKGKGLELQVLKGNALLNAGGKSVALSKNQIGKLDGGNLEVEKDLIEIQKPLSNTKVFVDFIQKEKVQISWKKLAQGYDVEILSGKKPDRLEKTNAQMITKTVDGLSVAFKPGIVYWQLRAKPKVQGLKPLKSPTVKIKVVSIKPPVFVEPQIGQRIRLKPSEPTYEFRWTDPMGMENVSFQIWRKNKKGQMVKGSMQTASVEDSRYLHSFNSGGQYSARITGYIKAGKGQSRAISSQAVNFDVSLSNKLEPPILKAPLQAQRIRYSRARESGLFLSWEPVVGAAKYRLKVKRPGQKKDFVDQELEESVYDFKKFTPGDYVWAVASVGENGKRSKFGEKRRFSVTDVPVLAWKSETEEGYSYYVGRQSQLNLEWEAGQQEIASYRVLYSPQGKWADAKTFKAEQTKAKKNVQKDGFYDVQVQALNSGNEVVAQTSRKTVSVKLLPRLAKPEFDPSINSRVEADKKGNINLFWEQVSGAKEYLIRLQKKGWDDGKFKDVKTSDVRMTLQSLKPGTYKAQLYAVDKFERLSSESDERMIRVKNKSDIRAPSSIKKIKVKGVFRKGR